MGLSFDDALAPALGFAWKNCSRALIGWATHMSHRLTHGRQVVRTRKEEILETSIAFNSIFICQAEASEIQIR